MTVLGEFLPDGPAFPKGRSWPLVVIEIQNSNGSFRRHRRRNEVAQRAAATRQKRSLPGKT